MSSSIILYPEYVIKNWNPDRGFGFIDTDLGTVFIHATSINPLPPRGYNLNNRILIDVTLEPGRKGFRVKSAEMKPLYIYDWYFDGKTVSAKKYYYELYDKSLWPHLVDIKFDIIRTDNISGPYLFLNGLKEARMVGCPVEILNSAYECLNRAIKKWREEKRIRMILEDAIIQAELCQRGHRDHAALVFHNLDLIINQSSRTPLHQEFIDAWQEFLSKLEILGSNITYSWALYPKSEILYFTGGDRALPGVKVSDPNNNICKSYTFPLMPHFRSKTDRVFVGEYGFGPIETYQKSHRGGRYALVGIHGIERHGLDYD